jgi:hypothetical protein
MINFNFCNLISHQLTFTYTPRDARHRLKIIVVGRARIYLFQKRTARNKNLNYSCVTTYEQLVGHTCVNCFISYNWKGDKSCFKKNQLDGINVTKKTVNEVGVILDFTPTCSSRNET